MMISAILLVQCCSQGGGGSRSLTKVFVGNSVVVCVTIALKSSSNQRGAKLVLLLYIFYFIRIVLH